MDKFVTKKGKKNKMAEDTDAGSEKPAKKQKGEKASESKDEANGEAAMDTSSRPSPKTLAI